MRVAGRWAVGLALGVATLALAGCKTTEVDQVPNLAPIEVAMGEELAPIQLDRVTFNLRRGAQIGTYREDLFQCGSRPGGIAWNAGRIDVEPEEFADLFYEEFSAANFNVLGDPKRQFARRDVQPAFLVGAQVTDVKMDVCDHFDVLAGRWREQQSGMASMRVTWQLYSVFDGKVVYETESAGFTQVEEPVASGEMVLLTEAFAAAAGNLTADRGFYEALRGGPPTVQDVRNVAGAPIELPRQDLRESPIAEDIEEIRLGVVTLETGASHGSGFFVSPTLILTNHHVVEGSEFLRVTLVTGRQVLGEVVRSHEQRDVALVQVEPAGHRPLAIRTAPVGVAEDVYAIGTPLMREARASVTRGIVSRYSTNDFGLEDIQADVDIQPGNSGGALLDARGNVVGVSYAGYGGGASIGMNLFIPIMDALDKLNVTIGKDAAGS